jgi:tRNA(Ile)-lysidine synthase
MPDKQAVRQPLEKRTLEFIKQHRLILTRQTLLVAVSGGPDSVCLLHILKNIKQEFGINLHVAHLDHQLRGASSTADANYIAALAKKLNLPSTIKKHDVSTYRKKNRISLEEAAREVRYNFLAETARAVGADSVAVGHTLDDHIETILLHIIRGTGTGGLRGLLPVNKWQSANNSVIVVRPLLEISRAETARYCSLHRLKPHLDATNLSLIPLRNRIRLELIPLLKNYNPRVVDALLRTARIADNDISFLENEAAKAGKHIISRQGGTIALDKKSFSKLAPGLQRYVLRQSIEEIIGTLRDIESRHIEKIQTALGIPTGKKLQLPYGLVFTIDYDRYLLGKDVAEASPFPVLEKEYTVKIPGETLIPGWRILTRIEKSSLMKTTADKFSACLDAVKVGNKLILRPRRRGDRFQPLGMKEFKKISEFMLDARIPQDWRDNIPLLCNEAQVIWVVGYRIDERVKITENTKKVLTVKFERLAKNGD